MFQEEEEENLSKDFSRMVLWDEILCIYSFGLLRLHSHNNKTVAAGRTNFPKLLQQASRDSKVKHPKLKWSGAERAVNLLIKRPVGNMRNACLQLSVWQTSSAKTIFVNCCWFKLRNFQTFFLPNPTFCYFKASKFVDWRFWTAKNSSSGGFWGSKIVKY